MVVRIGALVLLAAVSACKTRPTDGSGAKDGDAGASDLQGPIEVSCAARSIDLSSASYLNVEFGNCEFGGGLSSRYTLRLVGIQASLPGGAVCLQKLGVLFTKDGKLLPEAQFPEKLAVVQTAVAGRGQRYEHAPDGGFFMSAKAQTDRGLLEVVTESTGAWKPTLRATVGPLAVDYMSWVPQGDAYSSESYAESESRSRHANDIYTKRDRTVTCALPAAPIERLARSGTPK